MNIRERAGNETAACKTPFDLPENENPDALAGASGRVYRPILRKTIRRAEYRIRHLRATALAYAIGQAHPDDARQLLTAALIDLSAGQPIHAIFSGVWEDASWWSRMATPSELMAFLEASLEALADKAMHLAMRKRLVVILFRSMSAEDRAAFLAWGQRHV